MSPTWPGDRRRTRLGTRTFITAIAQPTRTVPPNRPALSGHAARSRIPPSSATSASSRPRSSPSRARSYGAPSANRPKQTTGTVASTDCAAFDSPRSGRTGGISAIAVRMFSATSTTPATASAERGTSADGRAGADSRVGVRVMEGRARRSRALPSCPPARDSGGDALRLQRRVHRAVERRRDLGAGRALLHEDRLGRADGVVVVGAARDAQELLVRADLEELERVREAGELGRRVGLGPEEAAPVQRAEAHRGVLDRARARAVRVEQGLDEALVLAGLLEVLLEQARELRVARDVGALRQQSDRLALDRVRVGQVLHELLSEVVGI